MSHEDLTGAMGQSPCPGHGSIIRTDSLHLMVSRSLTTQSYVRVLDRFVYLSMSLQSTQKGVIDREPYLIEYLFWPSDLRLTPTPWFFWLTGFASWSYRDLTIPINAARMLLCFAELKVAREPQHHFLSTSSDD